MTKRLYLRLPNWLGDLLMSRPLLHGLRAARPALRVTAVGSAAAALLERERLWDDWRDAASQDAESERFDAALVLPPSFSSAWRIPRGTPLRLGFASDHRSLLLTHPWRRPARGDLHLSREYLALGHPLGAARIEPPRLVPTDAERQAAAAKLQALGFAGAPLAILGPGALYGPAKRWPLERYVALGRDQVAGGARVLACGGAADAGSARALAEGIGKGAASVAGETSLGVQLALCERARMTVCNDSGLAHLSAAAGAPTVVIFGSTSSAWTAPLGERVRVVQRAPVCSPCFQRGCAIGFRCLADVTVAEVARACGELAA